MKNKILIIGGHGKVGQYITRKLKDYDLILAGRNKDKMISFLDKEEIQAEIVEMNIDNIDFTKIQSVCCVIVCVDQSSTELVEFCDKHSIDYMDVTANSKYINKIQQIPLRKTSRILLGVGLAPGLTNLLAERFASMYPSAKAIEIQLVLGLGERYGDAAIKWTLDNFLKSYNHKSLGQIRPFKLKSTLMGGSKRLQTYNFNFVDQHMLNRKYADKNFTTYLGFDKSSVTTLIYNAGKIGLLGLLKYKKPYYLVETFLKNPRFGTDVFMVSIQSGDHVLRATGHDEGRFTGLIAAEAAKPIVTMDLKKGLLEISDVISLEEVANNKLFGLTVTTEETNLDLFY